MIITGHGSVDSLNLLSYPATNPFRSQIPSEKNWKIVSEAVELSTSSKDENKLQTLEALIKCALWGNQVDLNYTEVAHNLGGGAKHEDLLLVDDSDKILKLFAEPQEHVVYICDNSGVELLNDLVLIEFILRTNLAKSVTMSVKANPFYVSDAMVSDVVIHIEELASPKLPAHAKTSVIGRHLRVLLNHGRLNLKGHQFWSGGQLYERILDDPEIVSLIDSASIVFSKGDANCKCLPFFIHITS